MEEWPPNLRSPNIPIFKPTLSTVMGQHVSHWERQKRFSHCKCQGAMAEKCHFNIYFYSLFSSPKRLHSYDERREKEKKRRRRAKMKIDPKTTLFRHILKKITPSTIQCTVTSLGPCSVHTSSWAQRLPKSHILETGPWENAVWHGTTSWPGMYNSPYVAAHTTRRTETLAGQRRGWMKMVKMGGWK